jgi:hypothetical protein
MRDLHDATKQWIFMELAQKRITMARVREQPMLRCNGSTGISPETHHPRARRRWDSSWLLRRRVIPPPRRNGWMRVQTDSPPHRPLPPTRPLCKRSIRVRRSNSLPG